MPRTADTVKMAHIPVPRKASFMPAQLVRMRSPTSTPSGRSLPAWRSRMKMSTVEMNMIGVLTPSTQRQLTAGQGSSQQKGSAPQPAVTMSSASPALQANAPSTKAPATIGPSTSPMLPVERCMDMNRPRRAGKRLASRPNAGGCHNALPMEPRARAQIINPKVGAMDMSR